MQQPSQIGGDGGCIVAKLAPGDPRHAPPVGDQEPVAFPILLEGQQSSVNRPAVEFDHEPPIRPEAVDLKEAAGNRKVGVEARVRQALGVDQCEESLLQLAAGDPNMRTRIEQGPQVRRTMPPRVAEEQLGQRHRIGQSPYLRLIQSPLKLVLRENRRQVEQCPRN